MPSQPRQHVLQLRQFHLQLAFPGARVPRKNVENELGAVDHPPLDDFFNIALLRGAEIVIEKKNVGIGRSGRARDFFELARADQGCRIGPVAPLQNLADYFCAGTLGQRAQLRERLVGIELRNAGLAVGLCGGFRRSPVGIAAASRAARACAVTVPLAPVRPRVRTSTPTRNARSRSGSRRTTAVPRGTRLPARAVPRDFLV